MSWSCVHNVLCDLSRLGTQENVSFLLHMFTQVTIWARCMNNPMECMVKPEELSCGWNVSRHNHARKTFILGAYIHIKPQTYVLLMFVLKKLLTFQRNLDRCTCKQDMYVCIPCVSYRQARMKPFQWDLLLECPFQLSHKPSVPITLPFDQPERVR